MAWVLGLHLLAATFWIGGMLFLSFILVPVVRKEGGGSAVPTLLLKRVAKKFQDGVWGSMALLLVTGWFLLSPYKLVSNGSVITLLIVKMGLVVVFFGLSLFHGLLLSPLTQRLRRQPSSSWTPFQSLIVVMSPWLPRLSLLIGIGVIFLGVFLVKQ